MGRGRVSQGFSDDAIIKSSEGRLTHDEHTTPGQHINGTAAAPSSVKLRASNQLRHYSGKFAR